MFTDQVKIHLKAGKGGDGLVSFRHEKYIPYGGPFGGDGGDGGDIIFEADPGRTTLLDLRYNRKVVAQPGGKGKNKRMHGANGEDKIVKVPLGTIVRRGDTGQIIADLTEAGQPAAAAVATVISKAAGIPPPSMPRTENRGMNSMHRSNCGSSQMSVWWDFLPSARAPCWTQSPGQDRRSETILSPRFIPMWESWKLEMDVRSSWRTCLA